MRQGKVAGSRVEKEEASIMALGDQFGRELMGEDLGTAPLGPLGKKKDPHGAHVRVRLQPSQRQA